jgi:hypothetical protein
MSQCTTEPRLFLVVKVNSEHCPDRVSLLESMTRSPSKAHGTDRILVDSLLSLCRGAMDGPAGLTPSWPIPPE